ncbi:MAG: DUF935 family protein [Dehalococcoidia bacterium]
MGTPQGIPIKWEKWRLNLANIMTGASDQWFSPVEGMEIRNPQRQHSDRPWGANQISFTTPLHLYEHLRRTEPILRDTSDAALRSLQGLEEEIIESSGDPEHKQHCEWLRKYLERYIPTQLGNGSGALKALLWDAVDYGRSDLTLSFINQGSMTLPSEIESVQSFAIKYVYLSQKARPYFNDSRYAPYGIPWEGEDVLSLRLGARDPWRPYGWGVISSCYRLLYIYNYVYALALEGMERHDLPWILAKVPLGAKDWANDIIDADTRVAGMIVGEVPVPEQSDPMMPSPMPDNPPDQYTLEFHEMSRTTSDIFQPWLAKMEAGISYAYTSQTLANMQTQSGAGSLAQSEVHAESQGRSEAGWVALMEPLFQQIVDRIWLHNYPGETPPQYHIITQPETEFDAPRLTAVLGVADQVAIEAKWLRKKIGAPEPQPGEELVKAAPKPAQPFGFTEGKRVVDGWDKFLIEQTDKQRRIAEGIIGAAKLYAVQVAKRVMPALRSGLDKLAATYRGPATTKEQINDKFQPLLDAIDSAKESGDLREVRKNGLDLVELTNRIYDASITGWLAGYKDNGNELWKRQYADQLIANYAKLAEQPQGITKIDVADDSLRSFLQALADGSARYGLADWAAASAAIRSRSLTFANQSARKIVDDLRLALYRAVDEGLTKEQFMAQLETAWSAAGIEPSSPAYLEMVFRTVTGQSYGQGQKALADSESVQDIVWGYQMVANPGLSVHHLYHYPEMHLFAAPKGHQAWVDGWNTTCDFNCACVRITVLNREAERNGWMGEQEPVKPYVGVPPGLPN